MKGFCHFLVVFMVFALVLAISANAATLIVGFNDNLLTNGDQDYQDLVVKLLGANVVNVGNNASWQNMVTPNQDGNPYWDGWSSDANMSNIGYFLTSTGYFTGTGLGYSVGDLQYWGTTGGGADNSFYFQSDGATSGSVLIEVSGWSSTNQLYWYDPDNSTMLHLIVAGSATTGTTFSFSPGGDGDFALVLKSQAGTFSTLCSGQQAAVFSEAPVPEPATFALMGAGLLGLALVRRRRRQQ